MNSQMHATDQASMFLRDKGAWDSAIAAYSGPDPLELWYNYISWYDYNMRVDPENKFREALEKCLTLFEHNEAYKQDNRMVKLWIKYIDLQTNPLNLYQILYQRGVGTRCSCFYIGWAHYYDSANAFKQAESVYNLGFQAKAEPYDDLQEAHTKFRISLSHRMLYTDNSSKKRSANHLIEQRQQITNLNPSKKIRTDVIETAESTSTQQSSYVEQQIQQQQHMNQVQSQNTVHLQVQESQTPQNRINLPQEQIEHTSPPPTIETQVHQSRHQVQQNQPHQVHVQVQQTQSCATNQSDHQQFQTMQVNFHKKQETVNNYNQNSQNATQTYTTETHPNVSQHSQIPAKHVYQQKHTEVDQRSALQNSGVQSQTANNLVSSYTHVESDQCNLKNSAYVISSSLNYIYNDTQDDTHHQMVDYALENVKLPQNFVRYCKTNHETWKPLLFLEEPYDRNRRCIYRKDLVYPGGGVEFSPEEIKSRKWAKKMYDLKIKEQQQMYFQQENAALATHNGHKGIKVQQVQQRDTQEYTDSSNKNGSIYARGVEEQVEASTIRFSSDTGSGLKNKTITIKFKRDKSAPNSNSFSSSISYGGNANTSQHKVEDKDEQSYDENNGHDDNSNDFYYVDPKEAYKQQQSFTSSTPKVKKAKKVKIVSKYEELNTYSAYSANSSTFSQSTSKKNYDDANLLLSFANTHTNEVLPSDNTNMSTATNDTLTYNEDSLSNADFNSTYSESPYPNRSNCSTPVRKLSQSYSSKPATPLCRTLKRHTSNLSVQNDDSLCSYEQNSFFATESNDDLRQKRLEKALTTIEAHMAKEAIDPFNSELCKAFLTKIDFPSRDSDKPYKLVSTPIPKLANVKTTNLADVLYSIEKEVGRGSYGSVYKASNLSTGQTVALKYQKPANVWEIYICIEVRKRITNYDILPGFMDLSAAIIAPNASILVTEFSPFGSLLDINNKIRQSTKKVMHESLVMHFSSQILNVISHLHSCKIIHADIKPDNFLLMRSPSSDSHVPSLRLIDFGCAIDMTLFPQDTEFKKVIQTDGFTCIEMQEGRHWSYQTDYFCLAGTMHVMLFGEYMQVIKKFGAWEIKQKLPRYLKKHVWTDFFTKMLNIKDLDSLPDLIQMKGILDDEVSRMDSELQAQIRGLSNLLYKR